MTLVVYTKLSAESPTMFQINMKQEGDYLSKNN